MWLPHLVGMKVRLTSISRAAGEVSGLLDSMRLAVLRSVKDVEAQLDVVDSGTDAAALTAQFWRWTIERVRQTGGVRVHVRT